MGIGKGRSLGALARSPILMGIQAEAGRAQPEAPERSRWPIHSGVGEPPLFISIIPAPQGIPQMSPHGCASPSHPIKDPPMGIHTRGSLRNGRL